MKKYERVILIFLVVILVGLIGFLEYLKVESRLKPRYTGYVYFLKRGTENAYLFKVERQLPRRGTINKKISILIEDLLKGPTEEEKTAGISTAIPDGVKLLGIRKEDNIVYIDFSENIETGGGTSLMEMRLAQIVFTATQFPEVEKVKFLINGKEIKYFSSEGVMVDKPLGREDFKEFENIN